MIPFLANVPRVAAVLPADTAVGTTASIVLCARQCPPQSRTCAGSFDLHPGGSACGDASEETAPENRGGRDSTMDTQGQQGFFLGWEETGPWGWFIPAFPWVRHLGTSSPPSL